MSNMCIYRIGINTPSSFNISLFALQIRRNLSSFADFSLIAKIVARQAQLRTQIDAIVAELEGETA